MKVCKSCGKEKPLSEYYKHRLQRDGHHSECKECVRKAGAKYRTEVLKQSPRVICNDCRTCEDTGCRHNRRTA